MNICPVIKVLPWSEDQGEFVEINADDFDPELHQRFEEEEPAPAPAKKVAAKKKAG